MDDLATRTGELAAKDPAESQQKDKIVSFLRASAAAQKEAMLARRAGDRVRRDLEKEPVKLNADEAGAVGALQSTTSLDALLASDAADHTAEAHAIGWMVALDRVNVCKGLPKHLKIYATSGVFKTAFGAQPPTVPSDATQPLTPGIWLTYLTSTAKAAGHPIGDAAKKPADKEPLAWAGVLEGFRDKLRPEQAKLAQNGEVAKAIAHVSVVLEAEITATKNAVAGAAR